MAYNRKQSVQRTSYGSAPATPGARALTRFASQACSGKRPPDPSFHASLYRAPPGGDPGPRATEPCSSETTTPRPLGGRDRLASPSASSNWPPREGDWRSPGRREALGASEAGRRVRPLLCSWKSEAERCGAGEGGGVLGAMEWGCPRGDEQCGSYRGQEKAGELWNSLGSRTRVVLGSEVEFLVGGWGLRGTGGVRK